MCIFHKWDKWEQYDKESPTRMLSAKWQISGATEHWQKKKCKKCGTAKEAYIGQTVH